MTPAVSVDLPGGRVTLWPATCWCGATTWMVHVDRGDGRTATLTGAACRTGGRDRAQAEAWGRRWLELAP